MNRRQRRRRQVIRKIVVLGPPTFLALLWLLGYALPSHHREEIRVLLPSSAETVWAVLTDLDGMPDWRRDLALLERLPDGADGIRWREVGSRGRALAFERIEAIAPLRLVVRLVDDGPNERRWIYQILRIDRGVELALAEERRIDNPLLRTLVGLFGGDRGRISDLTRDLGRRLNVRRQVVADLKR